VAWLAQTMPLNLAKIDAGPGALPLDRYASQPIAQEVSHLRTARHQELSD
jgi:hypothetical protein